MMKYFVIFFVIIGFAGIAFAELDSSILEPFENNDLVLVGTVVDVNTILSENKTQYNIKIEEFLKGKASFDVVTAILDEIIPADFPNDPLDYYNKPYLEKGNQVLVYLKKDGATYKMSPYSFTIKKPSVAGPPTVIHPTGSSGHLLSQGDEIVISGTIKKGYLYGLEKLNLDSRFDLVILSEEGKTIESKRLNISPNGTYAFTFQDKDQLRIPGKYSWEVSFWNGNMGGEFVVVANQKRWTPLKQFKSGVPFDEIQCKDNLVLIQKYDGSPACVSMQTKERLIERGWMYYIESKEIILKDMYDTIKSSTKISTYKDKKKFIEKTVQENNLGPFTVMYIPDLKREYQSDEKITFHLELFGYHSGCIFPSVSLYVDEYSQDPIYTGHIPPHPCPMSLKNKPIIKSWDENDFQFFPTCKYQGNYTIIGNAPGFERAIGSFACNGEKKFEPPKIIKIRIPQGASDQLLQKNFEPAHITLDWGDYIMFVNQDNVPHQIRVSYQNPDDVQYYFVVDEGKSSDRIRISYHGTHWLADRISPYDEDSTVPWMNATILAD